MKLNLEKQNESRVEFNIDGVDTSFANMIRRHVLSSLSIMAIDKVTFYDNNSALWDEYLSHRLGLIPLITPKKLAVDTQIDFTLDTQGPKVVYSSELNSSDDQIKVAKDKIIIATLGQNQRLRLEAKAVVGTAKKHAKFQAGLASYGLEKDKIKFLVETFYQMTPKEVVARTCDKILENLDEIEETIGNKKKKA